MRMIMFLLFICSINSFTQWKKEYSPEVEEFWNSFDSISNKYQINKGELENMTFAEIKKLTLQYKRAIESDPVYFDENLKKRFYEWGEKVKSNQNLIFLKPAVLLRKMKEKMKESFGDDYIELISIPYLLKVKIEEINTSPLILADGIKIRQDNLICIIEDVLKGTEKFNINSRLTISYLGQWLSEFGVKFQTGISYLIALRPWTGDRPYNEEITLHLFKPYTLYKIENEIIESPNDFFGVETNTNWTKFKENTFEFLKKGGE